MKKLLFSLIYITFLMAGCISNRVVIPEAQSRTDEATIVGSRTMHNGARVDAYIVTINGESVQPKKGYKTEIFLAPGKYEVTVETNQCHKARHTFSIILKPNTVYVAQGTTVDYHTHKIWVSEKGKEELATEPVLAKKYGTCSIVVFM